MAVVPRKRAHVTTYYVVFTWKGQRVWERSGRDKAEAQRLEKRRLREVKDGTYRGSRPSPSMLFKTYAERWLDRRTNRTAAEEGNLLRRHVLSRPWYASMRMDQLEPSDTIRLVEELKVTVSEATGKPLSHKTVANVVGLLSTLFRDAKIENLVLRDVLVLPKGILRRTARRDTRSAYEPHEVRALLAANEAEPEARMFAALALLTGMREGEVCGRRWRDLDAAPLPLGALVVSTQYGDRPLKTEWGDKPEQPRRVPVHPALAKALDWWRVEGFAAVYGRAPAPGDFIVPNRRRGMAHHTKSSAYKMWRRLCAVAGVTNRTLHSTRHTFITLCQKGGANAKTLERITHSPDADRGIIARYTHQDWEALCGAVLCLSEAMLARPLTQQQKGWDSKHLLVEAPGIEPSASGESEGISGNNVESGPGSGSPVVPGRDEGRPQNAPHVNETLAVSEYLRDRVREAQAAVEGGDEDAARTALALGAKALIDDRRGAA